jgi:hypothetical protein
MVGNGGQSAMGYRIWESETGNFPGETFIAVPVAHAQHDLALRLNLWTTLFRSGMTEYWLLDEMPFGRVSVMATPPYRCTTRLHHAFPLFFAALWLLTCHHK